MAKNDNVKDFCKDVADAIRAKKGTTDLINPQDFATEIEGISGGGSGGGENTYEYIELTKPEGWEGDDFSGEVVSPLLMVAALLVKTNVNGSIVIMTAYTSALQTQAIPIAIAYDPNMVVQAGETQFIKVGEVLQMFGIPDLPRITKEQFYSLE